MEYGCQNAKPAKFEDDHETGEVSRGICGGAILRTNCFKTNLKQTTTKTK